MPPRMLAALVHSPRLDDCVVELQERREADSALNLLRSYFRKPAQMDGAERKMRTVCDLQRRQNAPLRAKRAALRDRELAQRVRRPPYAGKRTRRDFDAGRVRLDRICLRGG